MEQIILDEYKELDFISISSGQCGYLPNRNHYLYFFSKSNLPAKKYRELLDEGFRRSGIYIYKPYCNLCNECQIIRIPVNDFKKSKSQRRVWNKIEKKGFYYEIVKPSVSFKKIKLYLAYLEKVHNSNFRNFLKRNGVNVENYSKLDYNQLLLRDYFVQQMIYNDYKKFLVYTCLEKECTKELDIFMDNKLVGVGVMDIVEDAYSSVYFYYDPNYQDFSLGTFSVLLEIEIAKLLNLKYYYLGYYIEGCSKMNYKKNFRPNDIKRIQEKKFHSFVK